MKQSMLATKVRKEVPAEEVAKNAILLIRAGYISKVLAGAYSFLPLGYRSLTKISNIIREEMNAIGGQEVFLTSLQDPEVWKASGRWSGDADEVWFRTELAAGGEVGLGWTHEEPITEAMKHHIFSYRDLPVYVYQLQNKFRNEKRAKSGIMRTREFVMKDLYSFTKDAEDHKVFYEECANAYVRIFDRVGIGEDTYRTFASGGAFSEFSDEFQTLTPAGEDIIYVHKERRIALNQEVYTDAVLEKLGLNKNELEEFPTSEVGNIFTLGTRFSESLGLVYTAEDGTQKPVFMGSYGIGPARLLGIIVEKCSTDTSLVLPSSVAPYQVHLIQLGESDEVISAADTLYMELEKRGVEVLYDNRSIGAGEKFAEADLIGLPHRIVISDKTNTKGVYEYTDRVNGQESMLDMKVEAIIEKIKYA